MRTPSEDYRWQDHVPSLGSADIAAAIVIAAAFWLAVAVQLPVGDGNAAPSARRLVEGPLAASPVSTRPATVPTAAGCSPAPIGTHRLAAEKVDA